MKKIAMMAALAAFGFAGCMTQSRVIPQGATAEVVAGFSQDDIDYTISQAVQNLRKVSQRYRMEGRRRVVNVKDVTNDTTSRGNASAALAENMGQQLREELTNDGSFIVYNEMMSAQIAAQGKGIVRPEFVLYGKLCERNMRKDDGDFYKEYSLLLQLVGTADNAQAPGLEVWQKRIPLRKEVDRRNVLN